MSGSLTGPGGAIIAFRRAVREGEETRALARIGKDPTLDRTMEQFRRAVDKAPDIKTALKDPRVLSVVATALGIPEGAAQPGLATRALLSDAKDSNSVVNRLSDKRWKAAAETLDLAKRGLAALRDPKVQAVLLDGLKRARLHDEQEAQTPGLGDAVLFLDRAASAKTSVDILGDAVMRRVVTGALNLPAQIAVQSVETQMRAVDSRLKMDKLQNPKEVAKLAERYLVNLASSSATSTPTGLQAYGFNI